jgi:hypothetical protein
MRPDGPVEVGVPVSVEHAQRDEVVGGLESVGHAREESQCLVFVDSINPFDSPCVNWAVMVSRCFFSVR